MWHYTQQLAFSDAHARGHKHVIARSNPPPGRGYRYRSFANEDAVYEHVASRPRSERCFFEMIVHSPEGCVDSASRVHFDLEWDTGDDDKIGVDMPTKEQYLDAFCDFLDAFMQKHYDTKVPRSELLVLNASIPSKLSFHVLMPLVFTCVDQRVDFKARIARERLDAEPDAFVTFKGCPDEAIYTKNRVFRLPLCNKSGKSNHLQWWPAGSLPQPTNERLLFTQAMLCSEHSLNFLELPQPILELVNATRAKRMRLVRNPRDPSTCRPEQVTKLERAIYTALAAMGDTTSRIRTWDDVDSVYMQTNAERRCPHGHIHHEDNFHIRIIDNKICYQCSYTKDECAGNGPLIPIPIGTIPPMWNVPREEYEFTRSDGRPAVAPYDFNDKRGIVECSDMGGGKTYQMEQLIFREHTPRDPDWERRLYEIEKGHISTILGGWLPPDMRQLSADFEANKPFVGGKVLVVLHRITFCNSVMTTYLADLGFQLYSADTTDFEIATRMVICIDSLWKVQCEEFDLVCIDEVPEVIKQLCGLNTKHPSSGKWNVWMKLRTIMRNAKRFLLMSAQADSLVKHFLDKCHLTAHWCQNKIPLLSHLHYEFAHFEAAEMGYRKLVEALEAGMKVAVPCAEQKDLTCTLLEMQRLFPDKSFLRIDGSMNEEAKRDAVGRVKTEIFDAIFYTSTMDCGVSIDIEGIDIVVFRLNDRSINADVAMQMCQRVRKLSTNKIVFVCNGRVKNWDYWPGYISEKVEAEPDDLQELELLEAATKVEAERQLLSLDGPEYYYRSRRGLLWRYKKRVIPRSVTLDEAEQVLKCPNRINELIRTDGYSRPDELSRLLIDTDMVRTVVNEQYGDYIGLVELKVEVLHRAMNQHRDLVKELTHIINMQGAHLENTFTALEGEKDTEQQITERREEEQRRKVNEVLFAEVIDASRVKEINDMPPRMVTDADHLAKQRAYVIATFGDILPSRDLDTDVEDFAHPALMDIRWQRKFRELCEITTFADFSDYVNDSLVGDPFDLDRDRHEAAERLGMYNILQAFGFTSPFDSATVEVTDDTKTKLADAISALSRIKTGKQTRPIDPIKSAQKLLSDQWLVRPKQLAKRGADKCKYTLTAKAIVNKFGMWPTPEHLVRYKAFADTLNPVYTPVVRSEVPDTEPAEFRAFTTPLD